MNEHTLPHRDVGAPRTDLRHKILIVGLGGAGCRIADNLGDLAGDRVSLAAVDTDSKSILASRLGTRLEVGERITNGLGAGGSVDVGRHAAEDARPVLMGLTEDAQLVILILGLGGGTGGGAASVLLDVASECAATTLCFVTQPLEIEGPSRRQAADAMLPILREKADALVLVPNDRLFAYVQESGVAESFRRADEVLSEGIRAVIKMVLREGLMNLSLSDLRSAAQRTGGTCTFAFASAEGEDRAAVAAERLLKSPLLDGGALLAKTDHMILSIISGSDLVWKQLLEITNAVRDAAPKGTPLILGAITDETMNGRTSAALILTERGTGPKAETAKPGPADATARSRDPQTTFAFNEQAGRFRNSERTMCDGEDLDIPTFIRRGLAIDR